MARAFALRGRHTALDPELAALVEGLRLLANRDKAGVEYVIFTDYQSAIRRLQDDPPGPGQRQAMRGIRESQRIQLRARSVDIRLVLGHCGLEGNEQVDLHVGSAAQAAEGHSAGGSISLAALKATRTEPTPCKGTK